MWVDVIIPAYNPGAQLVEALESCMAQSYRDYTVTVIDDCSTQDVKKLIKRFPTVNYIRNEKNLGPAGARNVGIDATNSELISFLDADDIWDTHKLAFSVEAFRKKSNIAMTCGNYRFLVKGRLRPPFYKRNPPVTWRGLMNQNYVASGSVTIKRDIFNKIAGPKGFDERYWIGEDYDLWLRISEVAPIHFINRVLYYYRIQPKGASLTQRDDIQKNHLSNIKTIREESLKRMESKGKDHAKI